MNNVITDKNSINLMINIKKNDPIKSKMSAPQVSSSTKFIQVFRKG